MFEYIITRGRNKQVSTQLEQFNTTQFARFFPNKQQNIPFNIQINLFQLAYQMHLSKPMSRISSSRRTKFKDYLPYIKRITHNTHLDFDISDIDGEQIKQASEIIGESISRCLVSRLFDIQENSIEKIKGPRIRPDFEAITNNGDIIICESKGSFNHVSQAEIKKAVTIQKVSRNGHLQIAAINNIGTLSRLIDPPINNKEKDRFSILISKTNHYIQVFKLAGQQEPTRYFELMRKRFENENRTDFPEFPNKAELWFKLKYERQRITMDNKNFIGKVEFIENNKLLFIGFDERLLNVDSFELFKDYDSIYENNTDNSTTFISKDGVCFIEANRDMLRSLFPEITQDEMKNYQEFTWLTDIDNMNELEFSNYLAYIFQESDIVFRKEQKRGDYWIDYVINYRGKEYYLELKLFKPSTQLTYKQKIKSLPDDKSQMKLIEQVGKEKIRFLPDVDFKKQILMTNRDRRLFDVPKEAIVFDRNELKKLVKDKTYFRKFLSNLE